MRTQDEKNVSQSDWRSFLTNDPQKKKKEEEEKEEKEEKEKKEKEEKEKKEKKEKNYESKTCGRPVGRR